MPLTHNRRASNNVGRTSRRFSNGPAVAAHVSTRGGSRVKSGSHTEKRTTHTPSWSSRIAHSRGGPAVVATLKVGTRRVAHAGPPRRQPTAAASPKRNTSTTTRKAQRRRSVPKASPTPSSKYDGLPYEEQYQTPHSRHFVSYLKRIENSLPPELRASLRRGEFQGRRLQRPSSAKVLLNRKRGPVSIRRVPGKKRGLPKGPPPTVAGVGVATGAPRSSHAQLPTTATTGATRKRRARPASARVRRPDVAGSGGNVPSRESKRGSGMYFADLKAQQQGVVKVKGGSTTTTPNGASNASSGEAVPVARSAPSEAKEAPLRVTQLALGSGRPIPVSRAMTRHPQTDATAGVAESNDTDATTRRQPAPRLVRDQLRSLADLRSAVKGAQHSPQSSASSRGSIQHDRPHSDGHYVSDSSSVDSMDDRQLPIAASQLGEEQRRRTYYPRAGAGAGRGSPGPRPSSAPSRGRSRSSHAHPNTPHAGGAGGRDEQGVVVQVPDVWGIMDQGGGDVGPWATATPKVARRKSQLQRVQSEAGSGTPPQPWKSPAPSRYTSVFADADVVPQVSPWQASNGGVVVPSRRTKHKRRRRKRPSSAMPRRRATFSSKSRSRRRGSGRKRSTRRSKKRSVVVASSPVGGLNGLGGLTAPGRPARAGNGTSLELLGTTVELSEQPGSATKPVGKVGKPRRSNVGSSRRRVRPKSAGPSRRGRRGAGSSKLGKRAMKALRRRFQAVAQAQDAALEHARVEARHVARDHGETEHSPACKTSDHVDGGPSNVGAFISDDEGDDEVLMTIGGDVDGGEGSNPVHSRVQELGLQPPTVQIYPRRE